MAGQTKNYFTVFSVLPGGFNDALFEAGTQEGYHYVDLWNHEEIKTERG